ncbi:ribonuclease H [Senna tora]|uniref:Ribonuclease H n=1 Tax=Senna tora TaxID=362788 RepID=A0A834WMA0_9FABA|nr:ribonuclease H [Senna tora]
MTSDVWKFANLNPFRCSAGLRDWMKSNILCKSPSFKGIPLGLCSSISSGLSGWQGMVKFSKVIPLIRGTFGQKHFKLNADGSRNTDSGLIVVGGIFRSLMEGQLPISLNHAFRESNQCADLLAKKALLDQSNMIIYDVIPSFVSSAFNANVLGINSPRKMGVG